MHTIGLRLDPLDTLFFRDGRPFDAATRATGGLPYPQPLAGAIRTALLARDGFDFAKFTARRRNEEQRSKNVCDDLRWCGASSWILDLRFRGPWLAIADKEKVEPLVPVPQTLVRKPEGNSKGEWYSTVPLKESLPGWKQLDGLQPVWRKGQEARDAKHPGGFLTLTGIKEFLSGAKPGDWDEHWFRTDELYSFDHRTGIEIDRETLTSAEGRIYGISLLALRQRIEREGVYKGREICLYAEVLGDLAGDLAGPVSLGGEGRHVQVIRVSPCSWPKVADSSRAVWLLATPAFFPPGKSLPGVAPAKLIAAAAGPAQAFSGWDVARGGPRPTRFAVPAGSVYFVEGEFAPRDGSVCVEPEDIAQGWGHVLRGVWNYA